MVKLDQTVYVNSSSQDDEVITFGKAPELEKSDHESGISRFGGTWRHPSYTMSYVRASRVLVKNARESHDLDNLGLPIFYLCRHALELLIKSNLDLLYEVAQMRDELYSKRNPISKRRIGRLSSCHSLFRLNKDLKETCKNLTYEYNSTSMDNLIIQVEGFEFNPTWSRYSKSTKGEKHLPEEIAIPVVEIQRSLEEVVSEIGYNLDGDDDSLQNEVYYEWNYLMSRLNDDQG